MINIKDIYKQKKTLILGWLLTLAVGLLAYLFYESYVPSLPRVIHSFGVFLIIWFTFTITKEITVKSQSSSPALHFKALFYCAVIAAFAAYGAGVHYEGSDPLFGGGTRVVDEVPSDQKRVGIFWWMFLILVLPAVSGIQKAKEFSCFDKIIKESKKRKQSNED